jgi:anti-sigma regulatory factor (Ser/Thr protein kinase)
MQSGQADGGAFSHQAVYYDAPRSYLEAVLPFIREAQARAEPVLAAVPPVLAERLRAGLNGSGHDGVTFADITELGRNPGRIISALWEFLGKHDGRPARFVSEPFWPARSLAEVREAIRHEALLNLAFSAAPLTVLCPYDTAALGRQVLSSAWHTHPVVRTSAGPRPSLRFVSGRIPRLAARRLSRPPRRAEELAYSDDLRPVREFVASLAGRHGLGTDRGADLVLAVGELAANTLRHASGAGVVSVWSTRDEVICQVTDEGRIADPLVGRKRPPEASGLGLWVVHQVCDLVELRSGQHGTAIRMHMRLETP